MKEILIGQPMERFDETNKKWECVIWYAYIAGDGTIRATCICGDTIEDVTHKIKQMADAYHSG